MTHKEFYTKWTAKLREAHPAYPAPMFGAECGSGWLPLLDTLLTLIQEHELQLEEHRRWCVSHNRPLPEPLVPVVIEQVKEKYGTLRFYYRGGDEFVQGAVSMAEYMSARTCETCGSPGRLRGRHWVYTACDQHTRPEDLDNESDHA